MTDKEAMKLALDWFKCYADGSMSRNNAEALADEVVEALKERLADPMRDVQRLGQEIECPECKADVLYECVACSSNNYPPKENT